MKAVDLVPEVSIKKGSDALKYRLLDTLRDNFMARALLILYDIRATTHEGVKTMLFRQLIKEAKVFLADFAKKFSIVKALREDADYEDFIEFSSDDAREAIEIARQFIDKGSKGDRCNYQIITRAKR